MKDFLTRTLEKNPDKRLDKMSNHPLFKGINWELLKNRKQPGVELEKNTNGNWLQLNYQIDQDYNEDTYPNNLVSGWEYAQK